MRFSNIVSAAVVAAPLVVSAATGKLGYAIGNRKPDGSCKYTADYEADFDVIEASYVRTYTSSECNTAEQILLAAAKKGVKVILGVWPDTDEAYNNDKAALQTAVPANADSVYAITVGSEALYRGNLKGPDLLHKIKDMQNTFPNIKIGTADSWNKYADGTADAVIQGGVKLLLVNAFGFWQGQEIGNATATYLDDLMQAFTRIQHIAGSIDAIELWNGETGWPTTGGTNYGSAVAGTDNAKTFFDEGVCAALDWGFNVFYFSAFDEPWKPDSIGDTGAKSNEKNWGAYTADGVAKFLLKC
ncbi:glycoside hydrolase 3 protein [Sticta canariensis]|nr:glycoside hydrolase 3 protein [Sticta canariensis]